MFCAVINIGVHISFWIIVLPWYMLRSRIAGSHSNFIFIFFLLYLNSLPTDCRWSTGDWSGKTSILSLRTPWIVWKGQKDITLKDKPPRLVSVQYTTEDGWMASLTQQTWVWANSGRQLRTRKPGIHWVTKSQTQLSDWTTIDCESWSSDFTPAILVIPLNNKLLPNLGWKQQ